MNPETEALAPPAASAKGEPAFSIPAEAIPDYDKIVIDDDTPLESFFVEKQYRLLTVSLYNGWTGPGAGRTFMAFSNVGLFATLKEPPVVPDVMLSLDVRCGDLSKKENKSYFLWVFGKPPDVVIEVVANRLGGEEGHKRAYYARIGVPYYVIFDPAEWLGSGVLRTFERRGRTYQPLPDGWLTDVGLGVMLWEGSYEGFPAHWLRWCERDGKLIPTSAEQIAQERANPERQRLERLEAQIRALGQEPIA